MADKVITTWRPDTCGCELSYSWDRNSSEDERVHIPETHIPCDAHKGLELHLGHAAVIEENQRKNKVVNALADKTGVAPTEFKFKFGADRTLVVSHLVLSAQIVQEMQGPFDQEHGKGKVVLNG